MFKIWPVGSEDTAQTRPFHNHMTLVTFRAKHQNLFIYQGPPNDVLLDVSLTVKAATLIFISGCGSANPSAKEGKSGFIYYLVKR